MNSKYVAPKIIAEIGCNHKGDLSLAKELIKSAKLCGADVVKFQKRSPKELLSEEQYNAPHPNPYNSYGKTYGAHREFLEFSFEQHKEIKAYCDSLGIIYSSSIWDLSSAKDIVSLNPSFIKIPSAVNNNYEILNYLCSDYNGDIHISLGMTTHKEEEQLISFFKEKGRIKDVVLYSCTSGYPVPFNDVCLCEILRIKEAYSGTVKSVGFSGHHKGIAIDMAAYALGAEWIERHFTLDRTWKGTDHAASLEPTGIQKMIRDLNATFKSLTYKKTEILDIEAVQREKLKYKA